MPEYPTVQQAVAGTTRSSLDLLTLPYPFSQNRLMMSSEFATEIARELPH
jgi:hypothetical protein